MFKLKPDSTKDKSRNSKMNSGEIPASIIGLAQKPGRTQSLNLDPNLPPQLERDRSGDPVLVQAHSPATASSKSTSQSPAEVQTNPTVNSVNCSVPRPGSKVQAPPKDPGPIVVKVPAMALLKVLAQNNGQTTVRIPLQTHGPGSVLVPSTASSNIHLTASVQSLIQHPRLVQNRVQNPGIVHSTVGSTSPNLAQSPSLALNAGHKTFIPEPNRVQAVTPNPVRIVAPVQDPVWTESHVTKRKGQPYESSSDKDPGVDPVLIRVPLPPEAVRALSPPLMTTPLKPSVPPLGFRLNGKLLPLLPGGQGLEMFIRPHPSGSKSRLTSLRLTKDPTPAVFPNPPRPTTRTVRLPHPLCSVPRKSVEKTVKETTLPLPVKTLKKCPPIKPEPRPEKSTAADNGPFLHTGEAHHSRPLACTICMSCFKPVPELRGFVCMCSSYINSALHVLRLRRKDEGLRSSLKKKVGLLNQQRVSRPYSHNASKSLSSWQRPLNTAQFQPRLPPNPGAPRLCTSHDQRLPRLHPSPSPGVSRPHPSLSPGVSRPHPSPSPGVSRPHPSLNPGVSRPHPSPSPGVSRPHRSHSPGVSRPHPSPSPDVARPLPSPSPGVARPLPSPSPGVARPLPSPSPGVARPHPSPNPGVTRPLPSPSPVVLRPHPSPNPGASRPHPPPSPCASSSHRSPSPGAAVRLDVSSPHSGAQVTVGGAEGRLVIHLEDFYYGSAEGTGAAGQVRLSTSYCCIHCGQALPDNISIMQHTRDHMMKHFKGSCSHCFRYFSSSHELQRHLEVVHGPGSCSSRVVCRICELEFEDEVALLCHMKDVHKPGEMPYACGICGFRSSFFSQTWSHFEEVHAQTRHFLCLCCLRVFKIDRSYQHHVTRHTNKEVYSCDRCRLHFHQVRDRQDHQDQHHGTHVSVRTFQLDPCPEQRGHHAASIKGEPQVQLRACKRRAVQNLGQLLAGLHSSECGRCVECLSEIKDFQTHFPTRVTCSRCHFQTCCSQTFANHMINHHSGKRRRTLYPQIFSCGPRGDCRPECLSCGTSCQTGDEMALHLIKNTKHICLLTDREDDCMSSSAEEQSPAGEQGGFVSIERLGSSHLSITSLNRPARLSSPVAMTITVRGPSLSGTAAAAPLSVSQLRALFHSLLCGSASASKMYGIPQPGISRWARDQRKTLTRRRWRWDTTGGARWVLTEREQNRPVTEADILDLCQRTLGPNTPLRSRLNWAVDFLLRHDLGVETRSKELRDIGYSVVTSTWDKVTSLLLPPSRFCCLDEFPVFMDLSMLSSLAPDALRVFGSREELPLVEVLLCAASDGTLLRPMLFYNKVLPPLPHGFPTNVLLQAREGGYSLKERTQLWTSQIWLPHLQDMRPSLLLLDEHCGHMTSDFLEPLRSSGTELIYIPQGCSFLVQPLDQCVAPVVREFLKVRWSQLVSQRLDFSESDLVLTLSCWFSEVCHIVNMNTDFVHRSFHCVGTRYKTAEVTHHALNQSLHQALIQTTSHMSPARQSEEALEHKELELSAECLLVDGQKKVRKNQSEVLELSGVLGSRTDSQSNVQEQVHQPEFMKVNQSEGRDQTEEAGLQIKIQSQTQDQTEEAGLQMQIQSEGRDQTEEAGLQIETQSEGRDQTEEAGLQIETQSEGRDQAEEAGLQIESQSQTHKQTEEAGLQMEIQSQTQELTEEAGLQKDIQSQAQEQTKKTGLQKKIQRPRVRQRRRDYR